jgi:outer membrane protein assembly factor BamB
MKVSLALRASLALAVPVLASALAVDVLTNRYDIARTGANLRETALCVKNISSAQFGKLFEREVDGDVYAQPLIKTAVRIPNVGLRDVVYVATTNNSLYAFDADTPSAAQPFWHVTRSALGDPVPRAKVTDLPPDQEYLNFDSQIGIVATPVIDDQTGTIYVVAQSTSGGDYRFRLHAFDLATGREKTELHSPVEVQAAYLGNGIGSEDGRIRFRPRKMLNRPGLLLVDGVLYLAFTAHLDGEPSFDAHGWVLAYGAKSLKQISVLCTTPDGIQGGIWQSGGGLSAERRDGSPYPLIYAVSANGSVGGRNFSQSILQLFPGPLMSVKQTFTPAEQAYQNDRDLDLSTAPLLLPGLPLVVACSKEGRCYVVDRSNMRLVQDFQASMNSYGGERPANIHGTPVAWRDANNNLWLYVWGEEDFLRAYQFDGQRFAAAGKSTMKAPEKSMPGGMLTLSANGPALDSAVLWASLPLQGDANAGTVPGILRAFDASHPEKELWNSEQNGARDRVGMFPKFCPPVVANGKVYMATFAPPAKGGGGGRNKLVVYGLLRSSDGN